MAQNGRVLRIGQNQRGPQRRGSGAALGLLCRGTGQHHMAVAGNGGGQSGVAGGVACVGFGEQHRHADGTGPGLVQAVDHPGMQFARPGPAAQRGQAGIVNGHHHWRLCASANGGQQQVVGQQVQPLHRGRVEPEQQQRRRAASQPPQCTQQGLLPAGRRPVGCTACTGHRQRVHRIANTGMASRINARQWLVRGSGTTNVCVLPQGPV